MPAGGRRVLGQLSPLRPAASHTNIEIMNNFQDTPVAQPSSPVIELYGMGSPNVIKIILMLEEVNLPYRLHSVDVLAGEQNTAKFRHLNPNGKVPVLVDPDGPGGQPLVLFESGAILLYLSAKSGHLVPADPAGYYATLQWLMLQMSALGPVGGQAIHFSVLTKEDGYARRRFNIEIERLLDVLETRLRETPYVAGSQYTVADVAIFPWIRTLRHFYAHVEARTALVQWFDTIGQRPAAQRTLVIADGLSATHRQSMRNASPAMLDRYFGRVPAEGVS